MNCLLELLACLPLNLIVQETPIGYQVFVALVVDEYVAKDANGVRVSTHHHVREAYVVLCRHLTCWHTTHHFLFRRGEVRRRERGGEEREMRGGEERVERLRVSTHHHVREHSTHHFLFREVRGEVGEERGEERGDERGEERREG